VEDKRHRGNPHRRLGGSRVSRGERMPLIRHRPGKVHVGPAWTAVSGHAVDRFLERFAPDCEKPHSFLFNLGKNARYFGEAAGADAFIHDDAPGAIFLVRGITRTLVSIFDTPRADPAFVPPRALADDGYPPVALSVTQPDPLKTEKKDKVVFSDGVARQPVPHSPLRPSAYPVDKSSSVPVKKLRKLVGQMREISCEPMELSKLRQKAIRRARWKFVSKLALEESGDPEAWSFVRDEVTSSIFRFFLIPKEDESKESKRRLMDAISTGLVCVAHEAMLDRGEEYLFASSLGFLFHCVLLDCGAFSLETVVLPLRAPVDDYSGLMIAPTEAFIFRAAQIIARKELSGRSALSVYFDLSEEHLLALNSVGSANPFHDMTSSDVRDAVDKLMLLRIEQGDVPIRLRSRALAAEQRASLKRGQQ
jgi:hypothetical protein